MITTLQLVVFFAYVVFIQRRYGVLTSISASTYRLKGNQRYLFFLWLLILGGLNLAQGMEGWGVATTGGLMFSGITIEHESSKAHTDMVHLVGTVSAIVFAFVGLYVLHGMWIPIALFLIAVAVLYRHDKFIWYIEIVAVSLIIISYYLR